MTCSRRSPTAQSRSSSDLEQQPEPVRLIPAGVVTAVDHDAKQVHVTMTKDEIKSAPDYDATVRDSDDWPRSSMGNYYDPYSW